MSCCSRWHRQSTGGDRFSLCHTLGQDSDQLVGDLPTDQVHDGIDDFASRRLTNRLDPIIDLGSVNDAFRTHVDQGLGLAGTGDRVGDGSDNSAELDQGSTDSTAGTGDQDMLPFIDLGSRQHVISGLVRTHAKGGEFGIGQFRIVNMVKLTRRYGNVLSVTTITAVAVVVGRQINVIPVVHVDVEVKQATLPHSGGGDSGTDGNNATDDIGALYARETECRGATDLKGGNIVLSIGRVESLANLAVGVVFSGCRDLDQNFSFTWSRDLESSR